jgi:hypothetical protein
MNFSPDTFREPTYFIGDLRKHLAFREAISALHDVVVSDLRFKPRDREEYFRWLEQHEQQLLAEYLAEQGDVAAQVNAVRGELSALYRESSKILDPYYKAQRRYFDYLYKHDYDAWFVLDPVITINPDEVFFECFSQDESSYGRLSCSFDVFQNINEFACGTTNIDYSSDLYLEFQKIRDYKKTQLKIDPSGFEVATGTDDGYIENKIDLPDSWVRGFLQVSSAMGFPMRTIRLHPMDVHNICYLLRRRKEKHGPRSMRIQLKPGEPVRIVFEPWNTVLECPRSEYLGNEEDEIRIWGRRRLMILERLIPVTNYFTMHLLGTGMPSFYMAHMDDMTFTLGLSGWTANDWSRVGNFDLMAPRTDVDDFTKQRVFKALQENWFESADSLAKRLTLDKDVVLASLQMYTQAGRVIYDLNKEVFRVRELSKDPLPMDKLRFSSEQEDKANRLVDANLITIEKYEACEGRLELWGKVMDNARNYDVTLKLDGDQRLVSAECQCHHYVQNKLYKGPCEHILALRIGFNKHHSHGIH